MEPFFCAAIQLLLLPGNLKTCVADLDATLTRVADFGSESRPGIIEELDDYLRFKDSIQAKDARYLTWPAHHQSVEIRGLTMCRRYLWIPKNKVSIFDRHGDGGKCFMPS